MASVYLFQRDPTKYGGKQEDYTQKSKDIVGKTVERFQQSVRSEKNLTHLFHETLALLGDFRAGIAREHQSQDVENFGARRDGKGFRSSLGCTALTVPYEEYNKKLLPVFQKYLTQMQNPQFPWQYTEKLEAREEPCLGRSSSMEFLVFDSDPYEGNHLAAFDYDLLSKLSVLCGQEIPPNDPVQMKAAYEKLIANREMMGLIKRRYPKTYASMIRSLAIGDIRQHLGTGEDWVFATVRLQIGEQLVDLTQYATWIPSGNDLSLINERSIISLIHQDPFSIELMLNDAAQIFKEVIEWNKEDLAILKDKMALLHYELAHAMPFLRGSAAIIEWIEQAIYAYHGYELTYNPETLVNLEALTSTLPAFVQKHPSLFQLKHKHM